MRFSLSGFSMRIPPPLTFYPAAVTGLRSQVLGLRIQYRGPVNGPVIERLRCNFQGQTRRLRPKTSHLTPAFPRSPPDATSDPSREKHPSSRDRMRCESARSPALAYLVRCDCHPVPPPAQSRKPCRTKTLHPPDADPRLRWRPLLRRTLPQHPAVDASRA